MWDTLIVNPMINALLLFYNLLGQNFILAIAFVTILLRVITLPLNMRQQRSMMRTQELNPQIQAIQKKYKDNPQKMQEEFRRIGYNPADTLTGCLPTLLQFPILIGFYQAINTVLGSTPQALFELAPRTYSAIDLANIIPVDNKFLWLNLSQPDILFILPILVFASTFIQQKLLSPAPAKTQNPQDNPMAGMTQSMQYTMPLMFGFFSLQFPSGLSIYFILANLIGIVQGVYMKRVINREKIEKVEPTGQVLVDSTDSKYDKAAVSAGKPKQSGTGAASSKPKAESGSQTAAKRKKRSAKR